MRICVIPPDQKPLHPDHISSGQEKVARDQAELLVQLGHQVDLWSVDTSDLLTSYYFSHRLIKEVKPRSFFNSKRPNPQVSQKRAWCKQIVDDYDLFVVHTDSSVFLKELVKLGAGPRIISFIHAPFAGTMWGIGFNSGQGLVRANGGTVVAVSLRCKEIWNTWSANTKKRLEAGTMKVSRPDLLNLNLVHDKLVTHVVCPQFSKLPVDAPLAKCDGKPAVLSRIAPEKKIHLAFGNGVKFIVREDNADYYEKIKDGLRQEDVRRNYSHARSLDELSQATVLLSTWTDETSGINAFEAAERGVPSILCVDSKAHASAEFLPPWGYMTIPCTKVAIKEALANLPENWATTEYAENLAHHMRTKWDANAYKMRLDHLINTRNSNV